MTDTAPPPESAEATGQATLDLLDARLSRAEQLLYGTTRPADDPDNADYYAQLHDPPTIDRIADLERRLAHFLSTQRVYADLMKIYNAHPSLFRQPAPGTVPTQLSPEAVRATVMAHEHAYFDAASMLNTIYDANDKHADTVPDAALSAQLIALVPRMEQLAATQAELDADVAGLRARSERLVRQYYERVPLAANRAVADADARATRAEARIRRLERLADEEAKVGF